MTQTAERVRTSYSRLSTMMSEAGLLRRRPGYYVLTTALTVGAFAATWVGFVRLGPSWWQLGVAVLLGIATTQVAFLGHDAGHRQMFRRRNPSEAVGLVLGNLLIGLSLGWWVDKHTRHHANPNHEDHDPDVGAGAFVWTKQQAAERRGFGAWLARRQAYAFFPLLLLEGLNLHVASIRALFSTPMRHRTLEAVLLAAHTVGYLGLVFTVLPVGMALLFIAVHQAVWGVYMGLSFAPNHKGMPVLTKADEHDFLRRQVLTSRNVRGGPFVDVALGGLNYQIEHHLFPHMPRANLRHAQPIVRAFCDAEGVKYVEAGLVESYAVALRHLHDVGAVQRDGAVA